MQVSTLLAAALFPALLAGSSCAQAGDSGEATAKKAPRAGWLGVQVQDLTPETAKKLKTTAEEGAYVREVVEDSPAEEAGLQRKDLIVEFNGKAVYDADDLTRFVRKAAPGTKVSVVVIRRGERKTIGATLGKGPRTSDHLSVLVAPRAPMSVAGVFGHGCCGLQVLDLTTQLGEYFGAPDKRGVLVQEVEEGSAAGKAGFKAGDVILRAGEEKVEDIGDLWSALGEAEEGDTVQMDVLRKGARRTLSLEVEERAGGLHYFLSPGRHPRGDGEGALRLELDAYRESMRRFGEQMRRSRDERENAIRHLKSRVLEVLGSTAL